MNEEMGLAAQSSASWWERYQQVQVLHAELKINRNIVSPPPSVEVEASRNINRVKEAILGRHFRPQGKFFLFLPVFIWSGPV